MKGWLLGLLLIPGTAGAQSIQIRATCQLGCDSKGPFSDSVVSGVYSPESRGLERGNGNMWAPLTLDLWEFGLELCQRVEFKCPSGQSIHRKLSGLRSGSWSMEEPNCSEQNTTLSPMDPKSGAVLSVLNGSIKPSSVGLKLELSEFEAGQDCLLPIEGTLCGGDCLDLEKCPVPQTLCTPNPSLKFPFKYCVSGLQESEQKRIRAMEPLAQELACRRLVRESIQGDSKEVARCAAIRFETDCTRWMNQLNQAELKSQTSQVKDSSPSLPEASSPAPCCQKSHK